MSRLHRFHAEGREPEGDGLEEAAVELGLEPAAAGELIAEARRRAALEGLEAADLFLELAGQRRPAPGRLDVAGASRLPGKKLPGPQKLALTELLPLARREPGERATRRRVPLAEARGDLGKPLPPAIRRVAEALLGTALDDVVVHTGSGAARAAAAARARAFTVGPHIFFADGRFAPETPAGRELLLHELTHVAQWMRGEVPATDAPTLAQPDHPLEREAHAKATRFAQAFLPTATAADVTPARPRPAPLGDSLILRDVEGEDAVCVAPPTEVPEGGTEINRPGVVNWDGESRLKLRASDSTSADNIIAELELNSRVQVLKEFPGDWYFVTTADGKMGYVAKVYIWTDMPEPNAQLHRVQGGESAIGIAEQYYGDYADDWGQDLRFYVNVLAWANDEEVPDSTSGWRELHFNADRLIWVPSQTFAYSLKGVVNSGSFTYNIADAVGVAEFVERIGQLWDDFKQACVLAADYIPEALAAHAIQGLESALEALAQMLLVAAVVMAVSTAVGAAIGALAGGAGAAPGAAAGFEVGMALLEWMGLAFIIKWVAEALMTVGSAFGGFLGTVWDARGDEAVLDAAAQQLAEALGLLLEKIIEGLVMLVAAEGMGAAMEGLSGTRFGEALGESRFGEWLSERTGNVREGRGPLKTPRDVFGRGREGEGREGEGNEGEGNEGEGREGEGNEGEGREGEGREELPEVNERISTQRQYRHVKDRPEWVKRGRGSYFESVEEAQAVLDAYHSGQATVRGTNSAGHIIVEFDGVTGYNNNPGAGFVDQPTNVFLIKGTSKVSIVPTSPTAGGG